MSCSGTASRTNYGAGAGAKTICSHVFITRNAAKLWTCFGGLHGPDNSCFFSSLAKIKERHKVVDVLYKDCLRDGAKSWVGLLWVQCQSSKAADSKNPTRVIRQTECSGTFAIPLQETSVEFCDSRLRCCLDILQHLWKVCGKSPAHAHTYTVRSGA